ncbi:hypothetical protein BGZ46_000470 [Entomortierella lignicola]|nr:hypothetical protein BGZ46_000470 [Entomortierella lignicola]
MDQCQQDNSMIATSPYDDDANDLPLIAATSPFDDLVAKLFQIHNHHTPAVIAMSPPPSGTLKGLYEYASGNLSHWSTISEIKKKSTMLALSGVLNTMDTEMMNINGFEAAKAACLEDNFVSLSPDMRCLIDELANAMGTDKDIWKLKSFCREQQLNSTKNRTEMSNRARIINIVEYLCTLIEIENWSESSSENEFVTTWRHIFSILLSTTIAVRTGELGLTETRSDRQKSEWLFTLNNHNVKSRKVDLLFQSKIKDFKGKQCRQNIGVFEAKSANSSQNTTWIQIRKAIRLNKSVICALLELGVDVAPLILDIQGQRAYIYTIKKLDNYYCTGRVTDQSIRLPTTPYEMYRFITDGSLDALDKIKERLFKIDSAVRDAFWECEENEYQHGMSTTTPSLKRLSNEISTIWTPTKKQKCGKKRLSTLPIAYKKNPHLTWL